MIIRLAGPILHQVEAARESLGELTRTWGHDPTPTGTPAVRGPDLITGTRHDEARAIDPIALSALILSVPSTILAVADLADRIQKRRRAHDLITRAQELGAQGITVQIITQGHPTELATLDPDQLLDLTIQEEDSPPAD